MTMLFERFNERALRSVLGAQEQSRQLGQQQVGCSELLVGVLRRGGGVVERLVKRLKLEPAEMARALRLARSEEPLPAEIPFSPECKKVLDQAVQEATNMGARAK